MPKSFIQIIKIGFATNLIYVYLAISILIAFFEFSIIYLISLSVTEVFSNKSMSNIFYEILKIKNDHLIYSMLITIFLMIFSKILSLYLLSEISFRIEKKTVKLIIEKYLHKPTYKVLKKLGHQEYLSKIITLPEDLVGSIILSLLQLFTILITLCFISIGFIYLYGIRFLFAFILFSIIGFFIFLISRNVVSKLTKTYLNSRVNYIGVMNRLWGLLPSINIMKNFNGVISYLDLHISKKSRSLANLRIIKMFPKLVYDNLILLCIVAYIFYSKFFNSDLLLLAYGVVIIQRLTPQISGIINVITSLQSGLIVLKRFSFANDLNDLSKIIEVNNDNLNYQISEDYYLSIKNITIKYGNNIVMKDFSANFLPSEITTITGKSGSGKTSLLEAIGGIKKVNRGKIITSNKLLKFKYVQQFAQVFDLSVEQNSKIWLNIDLINELKSEQLARLNYLLNELGLKSEGIGINTIVGDTKRLLSGGQLMRLAIVLSLLTKPDILIIDEPTASLDSKNSKKFMKLLKKECLFHNMIVILSSHDPIVSKFSDKIINLNSK